MSFNFNAALAKTLNASYAGFEKGLNSIVAPTAFGSLGGWICGSVTLIGGNNARLGAVQGLLTGSLYTWVLKPMAHYVDDHTGEGEEQIHRKTASFLYLVGNVAGVALPILGTMYFGDTILNATASVLPDSISWMLVPSGIESYTKVGAVLASIAPAVLQSYIGEVREANKASKRN